jgi:hypothetical protein
VIESLEQHLGLIGGYSSLLWSFLAFILGGYQNFSFHTTLMATIYKEDAESPVP